MVDSTNLPEVDINQIATDLNGKMDRDCLNASDTGNIQMAKASMPSSTYTDLTLGASGTTYTAPANGWFCVNGKDSGNSGTFSCVIRNQTRYFGVAGCNTDSSKTPAWSGYILPVKQGDVVVIYPNGTLAWNSTNFLLRFYYAEGSESEA